ncbi:MAG TPA: dTMP kinase [Burkholderiales bacterium]|nr:dTMP kinase [Burkholderiales bacterium]
MNSRFITFEGIDGAGKTTHLRWLADYLRRRDLPVIVSREPGGTPLGEALRTILLSEPMHPETEALLMFAARREHVVHVIKPALDRGEWVLCDRFSDSTYAYQGGGRGVDEQKLRALEQWVHPGLEPGLTLLVDVPVETALRRLSAGKDRFEQQERDFFSRVREAYLKRARAFDRFRIVDTSRELNEVRAELEVIISTYCL